MYIGERIKSKINRSQGGVTKTKEEEAYDIMKDVIIAHVPADEDNFQAKTMYLALMIRRIIEAIDEPKNIDDKDYYGNKRMELAGNLISLLFEDSLKNMLADIQKKINKDLPRF